MRNGSESDHFNNILITHADVDLNFGTSFITQLIIDLFFPCQYAKFFICQKKSSTYPIG